MKSPTSTRLACALLFAGLIVTYGVELTHGLPNQAVVWSADSQPLMPLITAKRVLIDGWNTGWHTPYPDFHRFVMLCFLAPYMAVQYALGNLEGMKMEGGYPYGIDGFDSIFMHIAIITRLVSMTMALGTVVFMMKTAKALFPDRSSWFTGAIVGFSPVFVYYVHTETLDIPMLFWLSAAIFSYVRVLQTFQLRYYIALAALAAISTATKDYAYGVFVLMPIPLVWCLARKDNQALSWQGLVRSVFHRNHGIAIVVFLLAFVLCENLLWNPSGFVNHVRLAAGKSGGPTTITTEVRLDILSPARIRQFGRVMPFILGWVGLPLCLMGIVSAAAGRHRSLAWFLWPIVGYYLFTVLPVRPATGVGASIERTFIPVGLIMTLFGGYFLAGLWRRNHPLARCGVALLAAAIIANGAALDVTLANDTRYQVEEWFADNVPEGATVELYGYRRMCPRLHGRWNRSIVNQDETPAESDLRITGEAMLFDGLAQRSPEMIVVSEPFAKTWVRGKQAKEEIAPACREFFDSLDGEKLGYKRVARFTPSFSYLFGLPDQRRFVPNISVYQRVSVLSSDKTPSTP